MEGVAFSSLLNLSGLMLMKTSFMLMQLNMASDEINWLVGLDCKAQISYHFHCGLWPDKEHWCCSKEGKSKLLFFLASKWALIYAFFVRILFLVAWQSCTVDRKLHNLAVSLWWSDKWMGWTWMVTSGYPCERTEADEMVIVKQFINLPLSCVMDNLNAIVSLSP